MTVEYDVAHVADVPEGAHIVVEVAGREVGVFNVQGSYYALPNVCFHQNGPLCRGTVSGTLAASAETGWKLAWVHEGEIIVCPWHSLEYNIATGQCLAYPSRRLPTYLVRIDDERIKVTL
jgi:nitrite reductase/ring-hydroxylating ferredoxin subunit